jgi:hypothetical protein
VQVAERQAVQQDVSGQDLQGAAQAGDVRGQLSGNDGRVRGAGVALDEVQTDQQCVIGAAQVV